MTAHRPAGSLAKPVLALLAILAAPETAEAKPHVALRRIAADLRTERGARG